MTALNALKWLVPRPVRRWLRATQRHLATWPPVGAVDLGDLRRVSPVSRSFGFDRGRCVDRYYIEKFLSRHAADVRGRVLEIGDDRYTRMFGGDKVVKSDVLHAVEGNPHATIVADLTTGEGLTNETFDCIIFTQTLPFIYEYRAALRHLYRILAPGGVLLATFPGISQISRYDADRWGDYWRFTSMSARRLFAEVFPPEAVEVEAYGNVLAAVALLHGLAVEDITPEELEHCDPDYEVIIAVRAVKPREAGDG